MNNIKGAIAYVNPDGESSYNMALFELKYRANQLERKLLQMTCGYTLPDDRHRKWAAKKLRDAVLVQKEYDFQHNGRQYTRALDWIEI